MRESNHVPHLEPVVGGGGMQTNHSNQHSGARRSGDCRTEQRWANRDDGSRPSWCQKYKRELRRSKKMTGSQVGPFSAQALVHSLSSIPLTFILEPNSSNCLLHCKGVGVYSTYIRLSMEMAGEAAAPCLLHQNLPQESEDEESAAASTTPASDDTAMNSISRILRIVRNVVPGSDIARLQVPVQFNLPKSYLQCYGETVYDRRGGEDLVRACSHASELQRFLGVLAWSLSSLRLYPFGVAPLNPILGETHHVSSPHLDVLLEQVSHHPPITALYASSEAHKFRLQWSRHIRPHFYGNKMEAEVGGASTVWLDMHEEAYTYTCPRIRVRFLPLPGNEFVGTSTMACASSGLEATTIFKPKSCFGTAQGQVTGHIQDVRSSRILYHISGAWNRVVKLKHAGTGETSVLYDVTAMGASSNDACRSSPTFILRNEMERVESTESMVVWRQAMEGIRKREWEMARRGKHAVEERQRALAGMRRKEGTIWAPKHFVLAKDGHWHWLHTGKPVPPSPLIIPH